MQDKLVDTIDEIRKNDRYYLSVFSFFVAVATLLFSDKLTPLLRDKIVSSIIIYAIGAALIAQVQNMLGNRELLRCVARDLPFEGIAKSAFVGICIAHVAWFAILIFILRRLLF